MARLEEITQAPFPATGTAPVTNTAISLVRASPGIGRRHYLRQIILSAWGAAPAVPPTVTISGGGLSVPLTFIATTTGTTTYLEVEFPGTLMFQSGVGYQIDVPALGAGVVASLTVLDRALAE